MTQLTNRQHLIISFLRKKQKASNREIKQHIETRLGAINRITIIRDLDDLLEHGFIKKEGEGRSIVYILSVENPLLQPFDLQIYFQNPPDTRDIQEKFNFDVFRHFENGFFVQSELAGLDVINGEYRERVQSLSPVLLKKEFERLTIELSWKSSQIEGNTYSLIDTEILIKEHQEAIGHTKEEAQMILNHKKALDYMLDQKSDFASITMRKLQNLHSLVVENMGIERNIRKRMVGITGTVFNPIDNEHQITEALEHMNSIINNEKNHPFLKALAAVLLISYIQPFEDGNKRTARLLGNAILLAHDYCPLSYRSVDAGDYKKATLLFYEQNSAQSFKELFIQQFKFAVEHYFVA